MFVSDTTRLDGASCIAREMDRVVDCHSVTTPCLVSAVCHLLQNLAVLAPHDAFQGLKQEGFIPLLTRCVVAFQYFRFDCQFVVSEGGANVQPFYPFCSLHQCGKNIKYY